MRYALAICTLMLVGCATDQQTIVTREVKVPVRVACKVTTPPVPDYRFHPPYDNVFDGTRDLLGDRQLARAYENELRTALKACTDEAP